MVWDGALSRSTICNIFPFRLCLCVVVFFAMRAVASFELLLLPFSLGYLALFSMFCYRVWNKFDTQTHWNYSVLSIIKCQMAFVSKIIDRTKIEKKRSKIVNVSFPLIKFMHFMAWTSGFFAYFSFWNSVLFTISNPFKFLGLLLCEREEQGAFFYRSFTTGYHVIFCSIETCWLCRNSCLNYQNCFNKQKLQE